LNARAVVEEEVDHVVRAALGVAEIGAAGALVSIGTVAPEARSIAVLATGVLRGRARRGLESIATADGAGEAIAVVEEVVAAAGIALTSIGSKARGAAGIAGSAHGVAARRASGGDELSVAARGTGLARADGVEEKPANAASANGGGGAGSADGRAMRAVYAVVEVTNAADARAVLSKGKTISTPCAGIWAVTLSAVTSTADGNAGGGQETKEDSKDRNRIHFCGWTR